MAQAESHELHAIEEALERMREGRYGLCDECGESISTERLQALPYATMCIACQRAKEPGGGRGRAALSEQTLRLSDGGASRQSDGDADSSFGHSDAGGDSSESGEM